jgi:16S rRNA (guanine1207-N2)-methyltransferase
MLLAAVKRDAAWDVLLPYLCNLFEKTLWLADEGALPYVNAVQASPLLHMVSNRIDVVRAAQAGGHAAHFSDFDFSACGVNDFARVVYRVSKEKAVVHHVINQAARLLPVGGQLFLSGLKTDGIKTYAEKCKALFGEGKITKHGAAYIAAFTKRHEVVEWLDDQQYCDLRWIETPTLNFYSKPGVFGWDKMDEGSALLVAAAEKYFAAADIQPTSLLDLGCGYGYLTLMTRYWPLVWRVATDSNAAAVVAMCANAEHYALSVDVIADDVGRSLQEYFDVIVCNPPFHRGFATADDLTDTFLQQAARLLHAQGVALFVVNAFIPIEQKAARYFSAVTVLENNRAYKVIAVNR